MSKQRHNTSTILILFLLLLLCNGCALHYSHVGKIVKDNESHPLTVNTGKEQVWQTSDILVTYTVEKTGKNHNVSGTLTLQDKISYSFPIPDFFYFYLNYLDANGIVISSHEISPLMALRTGFQDTFPLRSAPPAPAEAVSFVFSYWGNFKESGYANDSESLGGGGEWEIFYNPFAKNKE